MTTATLFPEGTLMKTRADALQEGWWLYPEKGNGLFNRPQRIANFWSRSGDSRVQLNFEPHREPSYTEDGQRWGDQVYKYRPMVLKADDQVVVYVGNTPPFPIKE